MSEPLRFRYAARRVSFREQAFPSESIAAWAYKSGFAWTSTPDERWFRQWEPYDNLTPPSLYLSAVTRTSPHGPYVLVEPWYAIDVETEPLERTIFCYASHPGLVRRAAMRVGEHLVTRTAYLESPPPPKVSLGDALWDTHVTTFAASPAEAAAAFPKRLRDMLASWGFQGHLEMRPGGFVVFMAGLRPTPSHYHRLLNTTREILYAVVGR